MTCIFACDAPATTTVFSDYDGEVMPACDPCARLYVGDVEDGETSGGHINDGYADAEWGD